jgi:hypothetical protein
VRGVRSVRAMRRVGWVARRVRIRRRRRGWPRFRRVRTLARRGVARMRGVARVRAMTDVSQLVVVHLPGIRENKVRRRPRCRHCSTRGATFGRRRTTVCVLRAARLRRRGQERRNDRGQRRQECALHGRPPLGLGLPPALAPSARVFSSLAKRARRFSPSRQLGARGAQAPSSRLGDRRQPRRK